MKLIKKSLKYIIIFNFAVAAVLIPSLIYYNNYNQQQQQTQIQNMQLDILLIALSWTVEIGGTALSENRTLTFWDCVKYENMTKEIIFQTTVEPFNYTFSGFSISRFVYDILNVTNFSSVTFKAVDGYDKTFSKAHIDTYKEELFIAYKKNGLPMLTQSFGGDGPIRNIATLNYTKTALGDNYNAHYCVKWVTIIEINL